jgi:DNA-binding XRE family transcriptional regulator
MTKKRTTSDALEILHQRYYRGRPERQAELEKVRANMEVGRMLYDLRTKARLSQRDLARLVGTSASVICRLEDADYDGHSLSLLRRIATALNRRVEVRFVPASRRKRVA